MAKAKNKVIAGDYNGYKVSVSVGTVSLSLFVPVVDIDSSTVKSYEVITDEHRKSAKSGVARGLAGKMLLGNVGAMAGVYSAKEKGIYQIAIEFKDGKKSLIEVDDKIYKLIIKKCFTTTYANDTDNDIYSNSNNIIVPVPDEVSANSQTVLNTIKTSSNEPQSISNKQVISGKGCLIIILVIVALLFVALCISALTKSDKDKIVPPVLESSTLEEDSLVNMDESTVPHREGENIVGISDKKLDDIDVLFDDSIRNDVTGNWRLARIAESNFDIAEYAVDYYHNYFKEDNEVHAVVNFTSNTTTSITSGANMGMLFVTVYEYVPNEEHDAKILFTGAKLEDYIIYLDNGDIEKVS